MFTRILNGLMNVNEQHRRLLNRVERLLFALGILLIAYLGQYYRSLSALEANGPVEAPNILRTGPESDSIVGFGGPTPAIITLNPFSGTIEAIEFLPNAEDAEFWSRIVEAEVFAKYIGKTPGEAASLPIDAVSGATISARAAQETLQARLLIEAGRIGDATSENIVQGRAATMPGAVDILVVAVLAVNLAFGFGLAKLNPRTRLWLSVVNVVVLGFIAYCYLSFARIVGWINTVPYWRFSIPLVLFLIVVAFAVLKGRNLYCASICPYGCAQDLASGLGRRFGLSVWRVAFRLGPYIRRLVLNTGILALVCGLAFSLPEPFSLFQMTASRWVLVGAGLFLVVAIFIPRAWCRWLCPCGALLDFFAHNDKKIP